MENIVYKSINETIRVNLTFDAKWREYDKGLIISWEMGRRLRNSNPILVEKVLNGELPILAWKGGTDKPTKKGYRYGSMNYLAMWLGIRNEDLNLDINKEYTYTCTKTNEVITYTFDLSKLDY